MKKLSFMNQKYILVEWPESQLFFEHSRFNECYLVQASDHQIQYDAAYFVPEDLYNEMLNESITKTLKQST